MSLKVIQYQMQWVRQFQLAARVIRDTVGAAGVRIDHIGSTSVPGLHAKPVIDIQLTVEDLATVPSFISALGAAGFEHRENNDRDRPPSWETQALAQWKKHYFRTAPGVAPRIHLHVREAGRRNQRYALLFRDYLRSSERARDAYSLYKCRLVETVGHLSADGGTGAYLDLKDPVLDLIADAADRWASEVGWHPAKADA